MVVGGSAVDGASGSDAELLVSTGAVACPKVGRESARLEMATMRDRIRLLDIYRSYVKDIGKRTKRKGSPPSAIVGERQAGLTQIHRLVLLYSLKLRRTRCRRLDNARLQSRPSEKE